MSKRPKLRELAYMLGVYSQKTIPQTYINELSNYELLLTIFSKINEIIERCGKYDEVINEIINYLDTLDDAVIDYLEELKDSGWIANQIKSLDTKKYMIIGDSYTAGENLPSPSTQSFPALLSSKGFDVSALASSGGGFIAVGNNGTFYQLVSNYNNADAESYTDVLILGGINDAYQSTSGLKNQIIQTVALIKTKFINAKVHIGYISQLRRADGNPAGVQLVKEIYRSACYDAKCIYIDNCESMLKNASYIQSDGIHPTIDGHIAIANYLTSYFLNGQINTMQMQNSYSFALNDSVWDSGVLQGSVCQHNNIVRFSNFQNTAFNCSSNPFQATFDGLQSFIMGDIPLNVIWGQSSGSDAFGHAQATIGGTVTYRETIDGDDISVPCPLTIRIVQQTIFLTPQILKSASTYASGYVQQINIEPFSVIFLADDI